MVPILIYDFLWTMTPDGQLYEWLFVQSSYAVADTFNFQGSLLSRPRHSQRESRSVKVSISTPLDPS